MKVPKLLALSLVLTGCNGDSSADDGDLSLEKAYANWRATTAEWVAACSIDAANSWAMTDEDDARVRPDFNLWVDTQLSVDGEAAAAMFAEEFQSEGPVLEVVRLEFEEALDAVSSALSAGSLAMKGDDASEITSATLALKKALAGIKGIEVSREFHEAVERLGPVPEGEELHGPDTVGDAVVTPAARKVTNAALDRAREAGRPLRKANEALEEARAALVAQMSASSASPGEVAPLEGDEETASAANALAAASSAAFKAQVVADASAAEIEALQGVIAATGAELERNRAEVEVPVRTAWVAASDGARRRVGDDLDRFREMAGGDLLAQVGHASRPQSAPSEDEANRELENARRTWTSLDGEVRPALEQARKAMTLQSAPTIKAQRLLRKIHWLERRLARAEERLAAKRTEFEVARETTRAAKGEYLRITRALMDQKALLLTGQKLAD